MDARNLDFEDFCGSHVDTVMRNINKITPQEAQVFYELLDSNPNFFDILMHFDKASENQIQNMNYMSDMVLLAFYNNKMTRQQAAMFLEYISMKADFPRVRIFDVFLKNGEISNDFLQILPDFVDDQSQEKLLASLTGKKNFECCFFIVEVNKDKISDPRIEGTLQLANMLNVIHYVPEIIPRIDLLEDIIDSKIKPSSIYNVYHFNPVMRDLLTQAIYGEDAKHIFSRLGIFNIDDIERSVRKFGRYSAVDYYAVTCAKEYHGVKAPAFYNTLHDELHRRLISTIQNPVFIAYLHLVDIVREISGLNPAKKDGKPVSQGVFCTEVWDGIDMECGLFINYRQSNEERRKNITKDFIRMMNTYVYTESKPVGLCPPSPYIDTTWAVLINMVLHKDIWLKFSIDISQLATDPNFKDLYQFIEDHQEILKQNEDSPIKQIAQIKALWFNMTYDEKKVSGFRRKDNLIEILYDKQPMNPTLCTKSTAIKMLNLDIDNFEKEDFRKENPHLFIEFINRLAKDYDVFYENIIKRSQFDFIMKHVVDLVLKDSLNFFLNHKINGFIEKGRSLHEKHDYGEAIVEFKLALSLIEINSPLEGDVKQLIDLANQEIMNDLIRKYLDQKEVSVDTDSLDDIHKLIISDTNILNDEEKKYSDDVSSDEEVHFDFDQETPQANSQRFPLHSAAFYGEYINVISLLESGYDPMLRDERGGNTPIELAIDNNHLSIINELFIYMVGQSLILNTMFDNWFKRALYNALSSDPSTLIDRFHTLNYFVDRGANINIEIEGGWTVFLVAVRNNMSYFIIHLLSKTNPNVNINHQKQDGWTALHIAVLNGHLELTSFLLRQGADTTLKNNEGDIPIVLALKDGNVEAFKILFNYMLENKQFKNEWIIYSLSTVMKRMSFVPEVVISLMKQVSNIDNFQQRFFNEQPSYTTGPVNQGDGFSPRISPSQKK